MTTKWVGPIDMGTGAMVSIEKISLRSLDFWVFLSLVESDFISVGLS